LNKLTWYIKVHKDIDQPLFKNNVVHIIFSVKIAKRTRVGQIKRLRQIKRLDLRNIKII